MTSGTAYITVTLHWREQGQERTQDIEALDLAPQELVPTLVSLLRLPASSDDGQPLAYELRLGSEQRAPLQPAALLSAQGVRVASHLWLVASQEGRRRQRCLLALPDGSEAVICNESQVITRKWLLDVIHLRSEDAFEREKERLAQRASRFLTVSNTDHCVIVFESNTWHVRCGREGVRVKLNERALAPNSLVALNDRDQLRLGDVTLAVSII
jgi:hypothetical protein